MENLPKEIQNHVFGYLDDKSKRLLRLASKELFSIVQYNNFTIYFANSTRWPLMAERFSQYQWPIQLKFKKILDLPTEEIIKHLHKIKWLAAVDVEWGNEPGKYGYSETNAKDDWMLLTSLAKLQRFNVPTTTHLLLPNYTNLTKLTYKGSAPLHEFLDQATNLVELVLNRLNRQKDSAQLRDKLIQLTRLTRLELVSADIENDVDLRNMTKLKSLVAKNRYMTLNIDNMTSLEHLNVKVGTLVGDVGSLTKLTELILHTNSTNLHRPIALNNLTALKSLNVLNSTVSLAGLNPDSLTKLSASPSNIQHVKRMTNLLELNLSIGTEDFDDMELIVLQKLTSLKFHKSGQFPPLANLKHLEFKSNRLADFTIPTTLERLICVDMTPSSFESLVNVPHLTALAINLQHLTEYCIGSDEAWEVMLKLTNLQFLDISIGDSDRDWHLISKMTHLTTLLFEGRVTEKELINCTTQLTNIQHMIQLRYNLKSTTFHRDQYYKHCPYLYKHNFNKETIN